MPSNLALFPTRRKRTAAAGPEWVGGRFTMPFEIQGAQPVVALWVEVPRRQVVGVEVSPVPEADGWFARTLQSAMESPGVGQPRRPSRIRVADPALARELKDVAGSAEIVVGPAPELDEAIEALSMAMGGRAPSFVENGALAPELIGKLFLTAELLYRFAPWKFVTDVIGVDVPRMGIEGGCLAVIGEAREEFGFLLFPSIAGYHAFSDTGAIVAAGEVPDEIGTSFLSLSFERKADVPPPVLRAIKQHKWPVAGARAYPMAEHREESGAPVPLTERDARVLIACANALVAFCARHRDVLSGERDGSISESFTGDDNLTVRLTYPIEDDGLFEVEPPPWEIGTIRKEPALGRNDPCHCGSGRKYKKCHLDADQTAAAAPDPAHLLDRRTLGAMMDFAMRQFGNKWLPKELTSLPPEDALLLILPWAAYELPVDGRPLVDHFVEKRKLEAEDLAWIAAQRRSWMSIWEVLSAIPGQEVVVRDLLTGERRTVRERQASQSLRARDAMLGRVVDYEGVSLLCGMYARTLPPFAAAQVVSEVRARLRLKAGDVAVDRLRGKTAGRFMIRRWADAVEALEERHSGPLSLTNSDGEPIAFIIDRFSFDRGSRDAVEARLAAMDGAGDPNRGGDETNIPLLNRSSHRRRGGEDATVIAQLFVGDRGLRVETISEVRAAAVRRRVEEACGELLRHRSREQKDPLQMLADPHRDAVVPPEPTAEEKRLAANYKERYYRKWMDEPIPALRGKTPRQVVRSRTGRANLDLLLRQMENHEAMLPENERFDFSTIRDELGL